MTAEKKIVKVSLQEITRAMHEGILATVQLLQPEEQQAIEAHLQAVEQVLAQAKAAGNIAPIYAMLIGAGRCFVEDLAPDECDCLACQFEREMQRLAGSRPQ